MKGHVPRRVGVRRWWDSDRGSVSAFVSIFITALLLLTGLTLDGGLALATKARANGQAESAARAGAQAIDLATYRTTGTMRLLPAQADAAAQNYLARIGATGRVTVTDTTVTVNVTATRTTQLLGLIGIAELSVHGSASAQPQSGALVVEP
jgi:Flp pilus assembly protein TadG